MWLINFKLQNRIVETLCRSFVCNVSKRYPKIKKARVYEYSLCHLWTITREGVIYLLCGIGIWAWRKWHGPGRRTRNVWTFRSCLVPAREVVVAEVAEGRMSLDLAADRPAWGPAVKWLVMHISRSNILAIDNESHDAQWPGTERGGWAFQSGVASMGGCGTPSGQHIAAAQACCWLGPCSPLIQALPQN